MSLKFSTFIDLLQYRASKTPDRTAFIFLEDGESETARLTYGELHLRARAIGAWLQLHKAAAERVLLLYPSGLDYIAGLFGCMYAGAIAVPAYPPRHNRSLDRLEGIINDAQPAFALTTRDIHEKVLDDDSENLRGIKIVESDRIDKTLTEFWVHPLLGERSLAFLQYTSGSTATPKGVMLTHANLLFNERLIQKIFQQTEKSIVAGWLPLYHDMGLIGSVLQPIYSGSSCVLMPPTAFLQQPIRWLQTISRYKATTSGGPNFAYELCVRKIDEEQKATLDLSSWSVAFNGAEPIRPESMEHFTNAFTSCGFSARAFRPCYGLAEATLIVSGQKKPAAPLVKRVEADALTYDRVVQASDATDHARSLIGCGHALGQELIIVNPETLTRCSASRVGEIWVSGRGVAQGYWNNQGETKAVFRAHLANGDGPYLRTGDLGFKHKNELFITGRLKDLIIIRGVNHYPQDIEHTIGTAHESLKNHRGAAFSMEIDGDERLAVVHEIRPRRNTDFDELVKAIRQAVAREHGVNVYIVGFVKPGTVPVTTSGKIQRRACRQALLASSLELLKVWQESAADEVSLLAGPPWDAVAIQSWLQIQVASRLRLTVDEVDVERPLGEYGLDSLAAVEIKHSIEKVLGVRLPLTSFLHETTVEDLAAQAIQLLANDGPAGLALTHADESTADAPLSQNQRSIWFMQQLAPESTAYSIVSALRIVSNVDTGALRRAFQLLTDRHAILRTTFRVVAGEPVQHVSDRVEVGFEEIGVETWSATELDRYLDEEVHRPFDLETGPLLRIKLLKRDTREHVLLIAVHHIIADLWSLAILLQELGEVYKAEVSGSPHSLPSLNFNYADYVRWQDEMLASTEGDRLWSYWQQQLAGESPVLELPVDRPRPLVQTYRGASLSFDIDAALTQQLKKLGQENDATLYMTLLAAFQVLLQRYTNQDQFAIGSATAGRSLEGLASVVGYFVNPVVVRADLSGSPRFEMLLGRVRETVLSAFEHQDYPFASLVERVAPVRDPRVSPLFQTMFILQKAPVLNDEGLAALALGRAGARMELGGLTFESMALDQRIAQFDLTLSATELNGALVASLQYNTDLFEEQTITRLAKNFESLLEEIVADPSRSIAALPLLSESEQFELSAAWRAAQRDFNLDECVHELFERQVEETPESVAVSIGEAQLTYRELNERANQLARFLLSLGVGSESLVALALDRSLEMVIGLFGVLKVGAAYLPLDPDYPQSRLSYMMEDAQAPVVLTQGHLLERTGLTHGQYVVCLDLDWELIAQHDRINLNTTIDREQVAYIIYTSGSTGGPKGVMVSHGSLTNLVHSIHEHLAMTASDHMLGITTLCFDIAAVEMYLPLIAGACLELVSRDELLVPEKLLQRLGQSTVMQATPSLWRMLVESGDWTTRGNYRVLCGGEALSRQLAGQIAELSEAVWNGYGPTETTIYSSIEPVNGEGEGPFESIGRATANTQLHILDRWLQPVPVGVTGELYIGGVGVSRGYLNRPELTAERFIPNCFGGLSGARCYNSGDLARFLADGRVEYIGRADHQVKVRGHRIELREIESALGQHEQVRTAVVVAREAENGDKQLIAFVVADTEVSTTQLRTDLRERLPEYMVPAFFMTLEQLPLLSNGKVNRRQLLELAQQATPQQDANEYVAPRTATEEVLVAVWSEVLGHGTIGTNENFFNAGGHSLLAAKVVSRIRDTLGIELPLRAVFELPTIAQLAVHVENAGKTEAPAIQPRSIAEPVLSYAQQRLWFFDQMQPGLAIYNIPAAIRFSGSLNLAALEGALREIVRRHEVLRATFISINGEPQQVITSVENFTPALVDINESESDRLIEAEAHHPFDLSHGPLRVTLLRATEDEFVLLITVHHIASDGWSGDVFIREIAALYRAYEAGEPSTLAELPVQYGDYAAWQREWLSGPLLHEQINYWKQQLASAPAVLELPTDRVRRGVQSYRGGSESQVLSSDLRVRLEELSRREGVTLFMTLLAAWQMLLHRYTNQQDVVVGTPIAGRTRGEVEGLVGFFANTLVLRTEIDGELSFRELLRRVREVCLGAYSNQDLPFEKLVEELQPERTLSHNPLFQVFFNKFSVSTQSLELPDVTTELLLPAELGAKFDLSLYVIEQGDVNRLELTYNADLFESSRIAEMIQQFNDLLGQIVDEPNSALASFSLITSRAKEYLPDPTLPLAPTWSGAVHELFVKQAQRTPAQTAVVDSQRAWSYRDLDRRSNQLARDLQAKGVRSNDVVAVNAERSARLVCALLGVLKAGAAFMILDPANPDSYLNECLRVAQPRYRLELNEIDELRNSDDEIEVQVGPNDLAYIAFTSGSTGTPKGIAGEHGPLAHFVAWQAHTFDRHAGDRFSMLSGLSHDPLLRDIFTPLSVGATLCIPETVAGGRLGDWIAEHKISVMHLTPPTLQLLQEISHKKAQNAPKQERVFPELRYAFFGGDTLTMCDVALLRDLAPQVECVNFYGATETPQAMGFFVVNATPERVPVGRGIDGVQLLVLNHAGELAGVSEAGEICIRTPYLSRGYVGDDELTEARFVADSFGEAAEVRIYRTGDRGHYLPDGNVEFLGRMDREIKVLGHRVDPQGIEAALQANASVSDAVVVARESVSGDTSLVAYVVGDINTSELRAYLKDKLPPYMIPAAFVILDTLPLTPNGKVDFSGLPVPDSDERETSFVAARSPIEEVLCGIWSDLLGRRQIGVHDNFFDLGGHSLLATRLISRVRDAFQVDIDLRSLFETPTVAGLAERIETSKHSGSEAQLPLVRRTQSATSLPLSYAQERLWILDQLSPGNPFYNMNSGVRMNGRVQTAALTQSVSELLRRHEVLRTRIVEVNGRPVQQILPETNWQLPVVDLSGLAARERQTVAQQIAEHKVSRGFDLSHGGLLRALLLRLDTEEHWFISTMHHIVSDGWSMAVFVRELGKSYPAFEEGEPSPFTELPVQYGDYAVWQREWLSGPLLHEQISYWKEQLAAAPPLLELPTDRARHEIQSYRGGSERVELSDELRTRLEELSRREGVTLFMTLLAAWQILLHRYADQRDVVVGTPIAGRTRGEVEGLIGFFANTLVLRTEISEELSFRELLRRVREVCLGAYTNQDLPFEKLVEELQPERTLSHNPLVQVLFNLLSVDSEATVGALSVEGLSATPLERMSVTAKFDLNLALLQTEQGLSGTLEYSSDLFDPPRVQKMIEHLQMLLQQIVANPDADVAALVRDIPKQKLTIAIASTFTAEPLEESLGYWMKELNTPASIRFAPYNQVFQELLDPASLLRNNDYGANVILLRVEDWAADDRKKQIDADLKEFLQALKNAGSQSGAPYFIGLCPLSSAADGDLCRMHREIEQVFEAEAGSINGVHWLNLSALAGEYRVNEIFDSYADELAHVPFTQEFFTAIGTLIARRIFALRTQPYKVIALDCDQTLWRGICGEDGPHGIAIEPKHQALQRFMLDQLQAGKLLCLCSKNNEDDVLQVFHERPEMLLKPEHFAATRINWQAKSENLRSLATELQLSLNSFILIDDSVVECAEVRARCPEVMTLTLPADEESFAAFLGNVWAFDQLQVTDADKLRHQLYQQERERDKMRQSSAGLEDFLAGLELQIEISAASMQQLDRVAQLTQRTNQFNFTGVRRSVAETERLLQQENVGCHVVDVADRFGDYGLVGVIVSRIEADVMNVDTFLLSCRALGRNVEDTMLVRLAEVAVACGCHELHVAFNPTTKNGPASDFLRRVFGENRLPLNGGFVYIATPDAILSHPRLVKTSYGYRFGPQIGTDRKARIEDSTVTVPAQSEVMQRIAALDEAAKIVDAIRAGSRVRQSKKDEPPVAPRTPAEERMAKIWMDVLNIDRIGVHDNFFELGGHSLLATQLLSRVHDVFDVKPPLRAIFETPTIAGFAERITQDRMSQIDPENLAQMLAQLSQLSDEEASRLIQ
ncbi:MAG TPA: amino acid adenylation domain-containing protein [Pyrinomonadaceae bacterium]|nr:amino acid adenylation domain-containing protein [Pyrinomonadaceae bacterium]